MSFKYYKEILKTPFEFSIKYYAVLVIIAALITSAGTYFIEGPKIKAVVDDTLQQIENTYPEELVLTVKDGGWEVNQPLPLVIPIPETYKQREEQQTENEEEMKFENLIVLDKEGEIGDLEEYKTIILINEKNILVKEAGEPGVYPIKDVPDTTLDHSKLIGALGNVRKISGYLLPLFIVLPVFAGSMVYYTLFRGVYLLFVGLILFLVGKATKVNTSYRNSFRIALHAMTLSVIFETVVWMLNLQLPMGEYWFIGINLIAGFLALWRMEEEKSVTGVLEDKK